MVMLGTLVAAHQLQSTKRLFVNVKDNPENQRSKCSNYFDKIKHLVSIKSTANYFSVVFRVSYITYNYGIFFKIYAFMTYGPKTLRLL